MSTVCQTVWPETYVNACMGAHMTNVYCISCAILHFKMKSAAGKYLGGTMKHLHGVILHTLVPKTGSLRLFYI